MHTHLPQLTYLGVIPQRDHMDYGFKIVNDDNSVRLLVLSIANSVFRNRQLMLQEAPDLCFQKVLADLRSEVPCLLDETVPVTESDIENYRAAHLNASLQHKYRR